jgi:crossover junction endodeoxyribonuclease RuvC
MADRICMGIDPSLNSTGVAVRRNGKILAYCIGGGDLKGEQRLMHVRDAVASALDMYKPALVAYEGLAMGFSAKTSNNVLNLAELGGILKLLILERGIDILSVSPNSLKLFATGKGNAKKEEVSLALQASVGVTFSTSDQYDAAGLLMMGEMYHGSKRVAFREGAGMLRHRAKALKSCTLLQGI